MITGALDALYGGLDLHSSNVYCGLLDTSGRRIFKRRLPNDMTTILNTLEPYRERLDALAVESTYNWYWLVDGLQDAGYPVKLANPARMDQYQGLKVTDDKSDAFWLAEMLRLGILPEGHIYPKEVRPVRDMLRRRLLVVRQRTQTLLSLQSMLIRQTGKQTSVAKLKTWTQQEVFKALTDTYLQDTANYLLDLARKQDAVARHMEKRLQDRVKLVEPWDLLLDVPGIGRILGLTIMLETGPIDRFRGAGNYASYARAVRSRCDSNGKKKGENNRKNGNKYLGWAFVEAAHHAQRHYPEIKKWFDRKMNRTSRSVAVKALACKLSKAVFYILRDGVEFDEQLMFG